MPTMFDWLGKFLRLSEPYPDWLSAEQSLFLASLLSLAAGTKTLVSLRTLQSISAKQPNPSC